MPFSNEFRALLVQQPIELPVFHPVALKLTIMLPDPYSDFDDIVKVISEDQALSAQVIRMANSSAYMGLKKAETIKEAAIRLGVRQISVLAMAASQAALHTSDDRFIEPLMRELWQHSLACALGSWWVAHNTGHQGITDHAYLAALLHDIGKLFLLKATERMLRDQLIPPLGEHAKLLELFDELHVEQGLRIMDHWNIPTIYRNIVANHHAETFDPVDATLTIVRMVNRLSRRLNLSLRQETDVLLRPEANMLDLDDSQIVKLETVMTNFREISI